MRAFEVAFVFLIAAIVGCGASLRFEDQGAAYFEYCHAAERDPRLGVEEKIACWEAFIAHWSIEGERERARHARERIVALHHGEELPPLAPERERAKEALRKELESPAEVQAAREAHEEVLDEDARTRSPSSSCEELCEPRYLRCEASCDGEEAGECRAACKTERRFCQKACA